MPKALDHIKRRPVVLSLSGGKDSAAAGLRLMDLGVEFSCVFADTGWEAPETYRYLEEVLEPRFGPIARVRCGYRDATDMVSLIRAKAMFPSRVKRFCTEELKARPILRHLANFDDAINVTGVRRDESRSRASARYWHADTRDWGTVWQPLVYWTERDVLALHRRHGLPLNPLYARGASRVGCWPCINARKAEIRLLPAERVDELRELEVEIFRAADKRHRDQHGTPLPDGRSFFQGRGPEDLGGRSNCMQIDEIVAWSRTKDGGKNAGRQFTMFDARAGSACVWGLCG